jgi:hypothetical protein
MKYTIEGFDQLRMVELGMDGTDAIILRWFIDFYFSGKMKKVEYEKETYVWVSFKDCLEDIPIIQIKNKEVLSRRFKKLVDCGLMKSYLCKNGGIWTCFKIVEDQYSTLIEKRVSTQKSIGIDSDDDQIDSKVDRVSTQKSIGIDSKVDTKNPSINHSTKNHSTNSSPLFDRFWKEYPKKVQKQDAIKAFTTLIKNKEPVEEIIKATINYNNHCRDKHTEEQFVKFPATFLRNDRWRDWLKETDPDQAAKLERLRKYTEEQA